MSDNNQRLVSKDREKLQIPYKEYKALMEKVEELQTLRSLRDEVVSRLSAFLGKAVPASAMPKAAAPAHTAPATSAPQVAAPRPEPKVETQAPKPDVHAAPQEAHVNIDVPPIKKDIAAHFNKVDESGRLFSVFKQYYTFLNDACGGTVRVTMKDGVCSLWNYDEWEEFAFVDIYEGCLRVCIESRYTGELEMLGLCETPRLLAGRGSLVSVKVDDLNNTMLGVMTKAFKEVGLATS